MKVLGKGSIASWIKIALDIAWFGLWLLAFFCGLAIVAYGSVLALIAGGAIDANVLTGGEGDMSIAGGQGHFSVTVDDPNELSWPVAVPGFMAAAVAIAGGLVIVGRLRKLFAGFSSGEPFRKEYAIHLRVIWITMLVVEVSRYLILGLTGILVATFGVPDGSEAVFHADRGFDLGVWFSIFILIVLAEVFREGARLREEQELTI
jgi:hypothetical protein